MVDMNHDVTALPSDDPPVLCDVSKKKQNNHMDWMPTYNYLQVNLHLFAWRWLYLGKVEGGLC